MNYFRIRAMFAEHYNRELRSYSMDDLEEDYKNEISKFSLEYLSGSSWYVGPSFKEYCNICSIDRRVIGPVAGFAIYKMFN